MKYKKYYPSVETEKVFNDILGLRITVDSYSTVDAIAFPLGSKVADMRNGKVNDDGYRGIHVYLQKDHFRYPIEIQFVTERDKVFNGWLHDNTYKYLNDLERGRKLRELYDEGTIKDVQGFRKELKNVLFNCKKV